MFRRGGARPPVQEMIAFIEEHRGSFGLGPICRVLGIAPATFYAHKVVERDPGKITPGLIHGKTCGGRHENGRA